MTYVLSDIALPRTDAASAGKSSPSVWQRLYASIIESRHRSAARELRARAYLINEAQILLGGLPQTTLAGDAALPFNR